MATNFADLERRGRAQLAADGIDPRRARLQRSADMRYRGQINEVAVAVSDGPLGAGALERLIGEFHHRYETLYGRGAGFREARVELVTYRVRASAVSAKPAIEPAAEAGPEPPSEARAPIRKVYWAELGDFAPTPVFWGERLRPGNVLAGPAIVQLPDTTIVVHPGQTARRDPSGNFIIDIHGDS